MITHSHLKGLKQWLVLSNISDYMVCDLSQNPLNRLLDYLCIAADGFELTLRINQASSADLLRYLIQNQKEFGRSMHSSGIELILNNEIQYKGKKRLLY